MQQHNKRIGKTDWNRLSLLLMSALIFLIVALVYWHQNTVREKQDAEQHRVDAQIFAAMTASVLQDFRYWQNQLKLISHHPETLNLEGASDKAIQHWQRQMSGFVADEYKTCFIEKLPETPADTGCLKLNFASLSMLRKVEQGQSAEMVFIEDKHDLLMADVVRRKDNRFVGIVVLSVPVQTIDRLLQQVNVAKGYLELTQGETGSLLISHQGNEALKQGHSVFEQSLKGSFMRLSFWPQPVTFAMDWLLLAAGILAVVTVWSVQLLWLKRLLHEDSKTLVEQISDLQNMALKPFYPMHIDTFYLVSDALQRLAMRQRNDQLETRCRGTQTNYVSPQRR